MLLGRGSFRLPPSWLPHRDRRRWLALLVAPTDWRVKPFQLPYPHPKNRIESSGGSARVGRGTGWIRSDVRWQLSNAREGNACWKVSAPLRGTACPRHVPSLGTRCGCGALLDEQWLQDENIRDRDLIVGGEV